jgi:hypothetical protein
MSSTEPIERYPTPSYQGAPTVAPYVHPDGFEGYFGTVQGVRVSNDLGVWTSPDAYAGNVHDPMSQKPYMWNRNNSYDYSDPSGFCTNGKDSGCMGGVDWSYNAMFWDRALTALSFILPGGPEAKAGSKLAAGVIESGASSMIRDGVVRAMAGAALRGAEPTGRALKADVYHVAATWLRDVAAEHGTVFTLKGGDGEMRTLTQMQAEVNGVKGVVEYIVDKNGKLTHQTFKAGKGVDGIPN